MPPQTRKRAGPVQQGRLQLQLPKQPQAGLWESRLCIYLPSSGLNTSAVQAAAFKLDTAISQRPGVRYGSVRVHQQQRQQQTITSLSVSFAAPPSVFVENFYAACNGRLCFDVGNSLLAGLVPVQGHTPVHIQVPLGTTPDDLTAAFDAASAVSGISMVAGSARYVSSISGRVAHDTIFAVLTAKPGSSIPEEISFTGPAATRVGSVRVLALAAPCMGKRHVHGSSTAQSGQQQQQPRQGTAAATYAEKVSATPPVWHPNPAANISSSSGSSRAGDEGAPSDEVGAVEQSSTPGAGAASTEAGAVADNRSSTAADNSSQQEQTAANTAAMQDGNGGGQAGDGEQQQLLPGGTEEVSHTERGDGFQPSAAQLAAEKKARQAQEREERAARRGMQQHASHGGPSYCPPAPRAMYATYSSYPPQSGGYGSPAYGPAYGPAHVAYGGQGAAPYGFAGQVEGAVVYTPGGVVGGTRPRAPKAADATPWTPAGKKQHMY